MGSGFFFKYWLAQQARVFWLSTGLPNGFGGLSVFKHCLAHGGVGLGTGPPNGSGGVSFFNGLPNGPAGLEGFRFSMVCPTGPGGSFFNGSPNVEGFRFSMVCPTGLEGVSFFSSSPNVSDFDMRRHANPLNSHTARAPCYMCYMGLTRQPAELPHCPGSLLYVLYVLYGSYTPTR